MPLTLAEKIAEVGASVGDLQKIGDNGEYKFLRAVDVLKAVRHELFNRGIVIVPTHIVVVRDQPYLTAADDIMQEVQVNVTYRITDGVSEIGGSCAGIGQDYKGKALYKALTGSLKYFLMTLGLIAGVEDDAETTNDGPVPTELALKLDDLQEKFGDDVREYPISRREVIAWGVACGQSEISERARTDYLKRRFSTDKITELKRRDFKEAMAWACKDPAPLTPAYYDSPPRTAEADLAEEEGPPQA